MIASKTLSETDRDRYFWEGLHKNTRRSILRRIENTDSDFDRSKPISIDVVTKAAKYIFSDEVFERDRNDPVAMRLRDLTEEEGSSDDDFDRRRKGKKTMKKKKRYISESEGSEEEEEKKKRKIRRSREVEESDSDEEELKTKKKSKKVREESEEESSDEEDKQRMRKSIRKRKDVPVENEEVKKEVQSKTVEVDIDGLVRRIQGLQVDDREYAVCYFKLLEVKPTVAQLLPSPFQHMRNALVQQVATYPNNIPIPNPRPRSFNCHFCAVPGCKIGTCEVVNDYVRAGRVIREGRMVLYTDKSPIAWSSQGLKVSVDFRFGGPLAPVGTTNSNTETSQIQTMFISCIPVDDSVVSAVIQEEEDDDALVETFATTRSKAKQPKVAPEPIPEPPVAPPIVPSSVSSQKKNPAFTYESKAILPDAVKTIQQRILDAVIPGITVAELMS